MTKTGVFLQLSRKLVQTNMDDLQKQLLQKLTEPLKKATQELAIVPSKKEISEKNYDDDYLYARKKLRELVKVGEEAIEEFMAIAIETKEPYAFKSLSDLLKTVGDLTSQIIDNAKAKSDIDKNAVSGAIAGGGITQNNAIFLGNSHDLINLIKQENEKVQENIKAIEVLDSIEEPIDV